MNLASIASGSSGNCIYVGNEKSHFLIDAGISRKRIVEGLTQMEVAPETIQGIFVTHEHMDHISGLGVFLRKYPVPVFATAKTIDEILEKLKELDVDVSRSALGRHCKQLEEVSKSIRQSRIVAEALAKNFGDESENKVSQVNIELMHSLILKMMVNNEGETITMDSKDAFFMASSLQKLVQASKQNVENVIQLRKEFAEKAAQAVEKAGKKKGISAENLDFIKREIFGIV
mgnify:CR=1 FL=1